MTSNAALSIPLIRDEIAFSLTQADLARCVLVSWSWNQLFSAVLWKTLCFTRPHDVAQFQRNRDRLQGDHRQDTLSPMQQGLIRNKSHVRSIQSVFCFAFQTSLLPSRLAGSTKNDHESMNRTDPLGQQQNLEEGQDALLEQPFPNLSHLATLASELHNKGIVDHTNTCKLLQFVTLNTTLHALVLSNFPLASVTTSKLLGISLATHPNLNSVHITCFKSTDRESIRHVFRGAAQGNIAKLTVICRSTMVWNEDDEPSASQGPTTNSHRLLPEGYTTCKLTDLTFEAYLNRSLEHTLIPLLEHCPNLRRLYIPQLEILPEEQNSAIKEIVGPAVKRWCPKLEGLELACTLTTDEATVSLLDSCRSLKSLVLSTQNAFGKGSTQVLVNSNRDPALGMSHSRTLEHLDLRLATGLESEDLQLILTSCPFLTVFQTISAASNFGSGSDSGISVRKSPNIAFTPVLVQDLPVATGPAWVCLGLTVLQIGFGGLFSPQEQGATAAMTAKGSEEDGNPNRPIIKTDAAQVYLEHIFDQLGRLTKLQTLVLGGDPKDTIILSPDTAVQVGGQRSRRPATSWTWNPLSWGFRLAESGAEIQGQRQKQGKENGGLNRLRPLVQLRELDLSKIAIQQLSERSIVWMREHWPQLQIVLGSEGVVLFDRSKSLSAVEKIPFGTIVP
ncbi:hypothetical protein BGZ83_009815 [Gryganskiella cystojenkinii]|nr:hypothetical protein BGZ83_009815 [Gryganskiella cystojenkinii]